MIQKRIFKGIVKFHPRFNYQRKYYIVEGETEDEAKNLLRENINYPQNMLLKHREETRIELKEFNLEKPLLIADISVRGHNLPENGGQGRFEIKMIDFENRDNVTETDIIRSMTE